MPSKRSPHSIVRRGSIAGAGLIYQRAKVFLATYARGPLPGKLSPHSIVRRGVAGAGLIYPAAKLYLASYRPSTSRRNTVAKSVVRPPQATGPGLIYPAAKVGLATYRASVRNAVAKSVIRKTQSAGSAFAPSRPTVRLATRPRRPGGCWSALLPFPGIGPVTQVILPPTPRPAVQLVSRQRQWAPAVGGLHGPAVIAPAATFPAVRQKQARLSLAVHGGPLRRLGATAGAPLKTAATTFPQAKLYLARHTGPLRRLQGGVRPPVSSLTALIPAAALHLSRHVAPLRRQPGGLRTPVVTAAATTFPAAKIYLARRGGLVRRLVAPGTAAGTPLATPPVTFPQAALHLARHTGPLRRLLTAVSPPVVTNTAVTFPRAKLYLARHTAPLRRLQGGLRPPFYAGTSVTPKPKVYLAARATRFRRQSIYTLGARRLITATPVTFPGASLYLARRATRFRRQAVYGLGVPIVTPAGQSFRPQFRALMGVGV